jgi:hypothetical protein
MTPTKQNKTITSEIYVVGTREFIFVPSIVPDHSKPGKLINVLKIKNIILMFPFLIVDGRGQIVA